MSGRSFRAVVATMAQCGFRGDEVSLGAGKKFNGKTCISYANMRGWFGAYLPGGNVKDWVANPSADQLAGLKDGDLVMIIPPPSKADRFGTSWGNAPCYLEYSSSAGINAAHELAQLELHHPKLGAAKEATPLFRTDDGGAFTRSELAIWDRDSLICTGVERERAAQLTLHSYRRYLACALLAMGCSGDQICALLRWKSQKSLAAYAALNPQAYAKMSASAERGRSLVGDDVAAASVREGGGAPGLQGGTAWLHAEKPWLDPSRVDNAPGVVVFRRGGLAGSAEAREPAAAADCSVISHSGSVYIVYSCGESTTRFWL